MRYSDIWLKESIGVMKICFQWTQFLVLDWDKGSSKSEAVVYTRPRFSVRCILLCKYAVLYVKLCKCAVLYVKFVLNKQDVTGLIG
jgi:hypothetical protein